MSKDEQDNKEKVQRAYTGLAQKRLNWPNKYDIGLQLSKMLSDYALLSKVSLLNKRVLNIGCSEPVDEMFWVNLVKEWHAVDINEAAIEIAKKMASEALPPQLYSKLKFIVGDATKLDLEEEFYDVVVSFSTIDHISGKENRAKAISEMCRVLKRGGYLVVTVPNKWDFYYSYHSNKLQREGKAIFCYEYQFSPLELKKMLTSNGLTIIDCASTSFNPYSYFDRLLRKLKLANLKIYFGTRFGYLAQK
jgi:ubiquinone/menaquinone biosynthesis C-methylase UbiE